MSELEFARAMVTALQDALLVHAQGNPLRKSYSIAGRAMEFQDPAAMHKALHNWRNEVNRLEAAEAIGAGLPNPRRVYIRTNRP